MKKVLIAEDDKPIRDLYQLLLSICGFDIHVESNGEDAYNYLTQNEDKVDIILTDEAMPLEGDGLEFIRKARQSGFEKPIILYSGTAKEQEALEAGADVFLMKPVTYIELKQTIESLLPQ